MANNDVVIGMSVQDAEQVRSWQRLNGQLDQMEGKLDRLATKGKRAGKETAGGFGDVAVNMGRVAAGFIGVGSAIASIHTFSQLIMREYEAWQQKQNDAASRQIGINAAFREANNVLIGQKTSFTPQSLAQQVIRGANGIDPAELLRTFASGVNTAGDISPESVLRTVLETARTMPELNTEERKAIVSGALQMQKAFGVGEAESIAGVQQASVAAMPESTAEFSRNMIPAIAQSRAFGSDKDSFEFLSSSIIGFGMRAGDTSGRRTGTNWINMLRQVKEETLAAGLVGKDASVEEQINAVRNSPELQRKMLGVFAKESGTTTASMLNRIRKERDLGGNFSTEAKTFIAGMEFLGADQNNATMREIASAGDKIMGLTPAAVRAVDESNAAVRGSPFSRAAELDRIRMQAQNERLLNDKGGLKSVSREFLDEISKELDDPATIRSFSRIADDAANMGPGGGQLEFVRDRALARARSIRSRASMDEFIDPTAEFPTRPVSEKEFQSAGKLEAIAEKLDELIRLGKEAAGGQPVVIAGDKRANVQPKPAAAKGMSDK